MVIPSEFKSPQAPLADSRVCGLCDDVTVQGRLLARYCCLRGTHELRRGLQGMTNKWHIHKGRGRSNSE